MNPHELTVLRRGLEQGKGFSVITNFGCDKNCWYCIWKQHPMCTVQAKTDFDNLQRALAMVGLFQAAQQKQVTVSISGGGEPLYQFPKHQDWFEDFFRLANLFELYTSLHTGAWKIAHNSWLMEKFDEYVLHFSSSEFYNIHDNTRMLQRMRMKIPIRLAFVLTSEWTCEMIKHAVAIAQHTLNCKISFRELWAVKDEVRPEVLELVKDVQGIYSQARYVTQADYNLYYMPDNRIYNTFMLEQVQ
jgi:hypothetical protein